MCDAVKTSLAVSLTGQCQASYSSYMSADGAVSTDVELGCGVHLDFDIAALTHVVGVLQEALLSALRSQNETEVDQSAKPTE